MHGATERLMGMEGGYYTALGDGDGALCLPGGGKMMLHDPGVRMATLPLLKIKRMAFSLMRMGYKTPILWKWGWVHYITPSERGGQHALPWTEGGMLFLPEVRR